MSLAVVLPRKERKKQKGSLLLPRIPAVIYTTDPILCHHQIVFPLKVHENRAMESLVFTITDVRSLRNLSNAVQCMSTGKY